MLLQAAGIEVRFRFVLRLEHSLLLFMSPAVLLNIEGVNGVHDQSHDVTSVLSDLEVLEVNHVAEGLGRVIVFKTRHLKEGFLNGDFIGQVGRNQLLLNDGDVLVGDAEPGGVGLLEKGSHDSVLVEPEGQIEV